MSDDMKSERDRALTVGELIAVLSKFPDTAPVGRAGHFGEFHGYAKGCVREARSDTVGWSLTNTAEFAYVRIDPPSIGDEPE